MKEEIGNPSIDFLKDHIDKLQKRHERQLEQIKEDNREYAEEVAIEFAYDRELEDRADLIAWLEGYIEGLRAIDNINYISDALIMADTLQVVRDCIEKEFYKGHFDKYRKDNKGWDFIGIVDSKKSKRRNKGELN